MASQVSAALHVVKDSGRAHRARGFLIQGHRSPSPRSEVDRTGGPMRL
jgi:hypothetical protein